MGEEPWGPVSEGVKDIIRSLLNLDPAKRSTASEVLDNPWLSEKKEILSRKSLYAGQKELKKFRCRKKLKVAMHTVMFTAACRSISVNGALFSGKKERTSIKELKEHTG